MSALSCFKALTLSQINAGTVNIANLFLYAIIYQLKNPNRETKVRLGFKYKYYNEFSKFISRLKIILFR